MSATATAATMQLALLRGGVPRWRLSRPTCPIAVGRSPCDSPCTTSPFAASDAIPSAAA